MKTAKDIDQLSDFLEQASSRNASICKDLSSYSHTVTTICITQRSGESRTVGKVHIVDLACPIKSDLNPSTKLSASTNCCLESLRSLIDAMQKSQGSTAITALCKSSVLTHMLQECFGPSSLILMMGIISPCFADLEETLGTLRYTSRAIPTLNSHLSASPSITDRLSPKTSPQVSPRVSHHEACSPSPSPRALERRKSDLERSIAVHEREIFNAKWQIEALNERLNHLEH
jgi:hypothetical protein